MKVGKSYYSQATYDAIVGMPKGPMTEWLNYKSYPSSFKRIFPDEAKQTLKRYLTLRDEKRQKAIAAWEVEINKKKLFKRLKKWLFK